MTATADALAPALLDEAQRQLDHSVAIIKHCLDQLGDEQIWWRPKHDMNSIANLILHLCGNVGQWIIAGLSSAPDTRNRPQEFADRSGLPKAALLERLDTTVQNAHAALSAVPPADLLAPRRIQGFDTTALSAIFDALTHFRGHTQEIICLTRMQLGKGYRFHWTPQSPEQGAPQP